MGIGRAQYTRIDLAAIVTLWLSLVATMLVLQQLGLDFGFDIWPMGEFRNWIEFLQDRNGFNAAKLFWAQDNRNALSPWWFIAARPLIDATPAAPLILHLLIGLFVGIAAYLLLAELTQSRCFALSVGSLSALFISNAYQSSVIWNLVGALGCSLISIWLFAVFCKDRSQRGYLAASYVAWFVAIGTYTIQIGAIGAIFFVSLRKRLTTRSWIGAILGAGADILPYTALLILYLMIWITVSAAVIPHGLHFQFSFAALARSIASGTWNDYYHVFWIWLVMADPRLMVVVFAFFTTASLLLLRVTVTAGTKHARPTIQSLGFALLISACIVSPTIMLEAGSNVWTPGTRWPMLMQFSTPFAFCTVTFAIMSVAPDRLWWPLWQSVTACAVAFVILLALGFNRTQVIQTRLERAFFAELRSVVAQDRASGELFPRRYLIQLGEPAWFIPVGRLADVYAHTILGHDVTFETIGSPPQPATDNTLLIWKDQQLVRVSRE
jgi:hypothetical protein